MKHRSYNRYVSWLVSGLVFAVLWAAIAPDADGRRRRRYRRARKAIKKKVVIMPFTGPSARAARAGVIRGLKRKARLVPYKRFKRAGGSSDPDAIAEACSKIKCHAVIIGAVKKRRRRFSVSATVYSGTGDKIGSRAARARGRRRVARAGAVIGRGCARLVRKGKYSKAAPKPKPVPVAAAPKPKVAKADTSDIPVYKTQTKGNDDDDDDDDDVSKRSSGGPRGPGSIFDVSVGVGLAFRNTSLNPVDPNTTLNPRCQTDAGCTSKYEGGMYPELTVNAAVYPLVPFVKGMANGIGLGVSFSHHLSISTKPKSDADQSVDTSSWQLMFDARFRWILFDTSTSPEINIFAGYGMRSFTLGQNAILSSFAYKFIRVGLEGKVPIMTRLFALRLGFDVRPLMGVGMEAVDAFGSRDGGLAWSVRGGVGGSHELGLFYFLDFEYLRHSIAFQGLAYDQADNRADYPYDRQDATEGSDRFIRIWVGGGYAY